MKRQSSIILGIKDGKVLLGMKKRGHGEGYWNGFGGKRNENETMEESALREIKEEAGIEPLDLTEVGRIDFDDFDCFVYTFSEYVGKPKETEEMRPGWFGLDSLPYSKMWEGDKVWLPLVLDGKKFDAKLVFKDKELQECSIKIRE